MSMRQIFLSLITDSGGDAAETSNHAINGLIYSLEWVGTDLAVGADLVVTVTGTGTDLDKILLTLTDAADVTNEFFIRELEHSNVGVELATYAAVTAVGRIKAVITDGGDTKVAKLIVNFSDP